MGNIAFYIYLLFTVSWFLHLTARMPALGSIRLDLLLVAVLFLLKFLQGRNAEPQASDNLIRKLNLLVLTILLITPFAQWPGSVLSKGLPNFVKAVVFFYFTVWFVNSRKKLLIFLAVFIGCQTFRFMEPLYLHITQGYWGSQASMANWEYMDRLAGAPSDIINPNGLAFVVLTVLPFFISFSRINLYCKIITIIIVPPALYVLMLTGSRSGFLAVLVMGLYLFYKSKKKTYYIIAATIVFFLAVGSMSDTQLDRYRSIFDSDAKNAATAESRLDGWTKDLKVGLRRPLFGHGLGTSLEANANFGAYAKPAHNLFVEVFQELGIVGVFMFLGYLWTIIKSLIKTETVVEDFDTNSLLPIKSAFAALAVTSLFFSFASYGLSSYEWYLIGGCVVVINKLLVHRVDDEPTKKCFDKI